MYVAISHRLPGRIRFDVEGMRHQPILAYQIETALAGIKGILEVRCNASTGRALIRFDERCVTVEQITDRIERSLSTSTHRYDARTTVAATSEAEVATAPSVLRVLQQRIFPNASEPETIREVEARGESNPYRLPMLASAGALGVLGVKRLLLGRSALAMAPVPFYIAAAGSIVAGYPMLRRPAEHALHKRGANPDLLLGAVALGFAMLRENLVALSAITILNIAMYRRHRVVHTPEATHLPPELERSARTMTRVGFWLSPLTWLLTGSPLRALGVLLAANPRPATLAHKYAWTNAEREATERQLPLPRHGYLENLANAKTIVFANGTELTEDSHDLMIHMTGTDSEQNKAISLAASLLEKIEDHPMRSALLQAAQKENLTHRTAFDATVSAEGISGTINGAETLLGSKAYFKERNFDLTAVLLQERRMRRDGYKPYLLAQNGEVIALIGSKQQLASHWQTLIKKWEARGLDVRCLQEGERPPCELNMMTPHELSLELSARRPVVVIGEHDVQLDSPYLVTLSESDAMHLEKTLDFCKEVQTAVAKDTRIVDVWSKLGIGLAIVSPLTAPLINLMGDFLSVFLLSRHEWMKRQPHHARTASEGAGPQTKSLLEHNRSDRSPYHSLEPNELINRLRTRFTGLTSDEVLQVRTHYGNNELEAPAPPHPMRIFLGQFKEFSTLILLGATGLSLFMGEWFNALCMGGILVVNAIIGTYQEVRSASVLQALQDKDQAQAKVVRDNVEQVISTTELVPGDIVLLEAGDMVPADLRILESWNVEVNEAILTGESLPAAKKGDTLPQETSMADRHNLMYMGTVVTRGRVRALVVATGAQTQIGMLQSLLHQEDDAPTPLQQRVDQIGKRFVTGALIAGVVVGVAGLLRGIPPMQLIMSSVTLAASAIPEGLPLTITIALTAGVMRMAKRKAVVRKLASLESLGRVTVICSDKTGTLTRNEMTVKEIVTFSQQLGVTGEGYKPEGTFFPHGATEAAATTELSEDVQQLLTIGLLCNNSSLEQQGEHYASLGDPTETALLTVARKAGISKGDWKRHREIPFDSNTGSMSVVCQESADHPNCLLLTKGSPEAILKKCTQYRDHGEVKPLTDAVREQIVAENLRMAEQALRVLGFGYRELCADEDVHTAKEEGLIYVGLVGMIDPPKEDVAASIEEARKLGLKPVMITGDHPITARAIGAQLGIYRPGDRILTGEELEKLSTEKLAELVPTTSVFARVSPEHKLRIVEAYQLNGEIVAMTGDGVNDAPAIRKANVGIAMGEKGTDITKDTAGIVLMEDHFQAIVEGIKEGRTIIGNIRKAIGCLLTGNLAEVLVTATAVIVGLPMPLIPLQILLMNLLTDALPAMVLATDPRKAADTEAHFQDVVDKPLYRKVITRGVVLGLGALAVFGFGVMSGLPLPVAQTMTFATLVAGQLIQTVSWRQMGTKEKTPLRNDRSLLLAMGISWLALAAVIYLPGLQGIFATAPLGLWHWGTVLAVSSSVTTISATMLKRSEQEDIVSNTPSHAMMAA